MLGATCDCSPLFVREAKSIGAEKKKKNLLCCHFAAYTKRQPWDADAECHGRGGGEGRGDPRLLTTFVAYRHSLFQEGLLLRFCVVLLFSPALRRCAPVSSPVLRSPRGATAPPGGDTRVARAKAGHCTFVPLLS